jgi:hypothetical protein
MKPLFTPKPKTGRAKASLPGPAISGICCGKLQLT